MKKLFTYLTLAMLVAFGFSSCTTEKNYYDVGADMYTKAFTVKPDQWVWNPIYERYEAVFDWDEIDRYMYEQGAVVAGIYVNEELQNGSTITVLRSLPFVHTYYDNNNNNNVIYTRTFGFDISFPDRIPGQIAFYVQDSDLSQGIIFPGNYQFKVTIFWEQ